MGHGIAQVAAAAAYKVLLCDDDRDSTLQHIRGTTQLSEIANADLIIEAAPEQLELKREILRQLESHSNKAFIFASNTSSLSITEIAKASARPRNIVGMHFFNPVHIMRLVEIVVGKATSDDTVETVREISRRLRKEPIVVRDVPGFASSRLGVALGLEAMRMLEQGVASAKDIDTAMELGYNHPMGPLKLTDHVGLDIRLNIAEYLYRELGSETFRPPEVLRRLVKEGKLGKKTGEGFYNWNNEKQSLASSSL